MQEGADAANINIIFPKGCIMSEPFIGEVKLVAFNYPPRQWAFCNGQLLPINQHNSLFSLIGTTYGGDGKQTFALPDLRGRVAVHSGNSTGPGLSPYPLGEKGGHENVTLTQEQLPSHTHAAAIVGNDGDSYTPDSNTWAADPTQSAATYSTKTPDGLMNPAAIGNTGAGHAHPNRQPFLAMNYCISLYGRYPSRP